MKVLVVEDDRIALDTLARQLSSWGYEVVVARNGLDAWEEYQNSSFSFVITDWLMPEMDGLQLLSKIRSSESSNYVYCILLTVKSQRDDLIRGMDAGADDFLTKPFDPNELRVRLGAGTRIIQLERKLSASNARMKQELKTAAAIQQSLLPARLPQIEGALFAWRYLPCDELGGDILNVLPIGPNKVALYLLDVSGHGVSAALLAVALSRLLTTSTNASSIVREKIERAPGYRVVPPSEVLSRLNDRFLRDLDGEKFFTMMYAVLDLQTHELCYASGGHNPAVLLRSDGDVELLEATGPVVGVLVRATFEQVELKMKPRDRLLLYSDGITEAMNSTRVQFGLKQVTEMARDAAAGPLQDMVDVLVSSVTEWARLDGLQDDVSCLALETLESLTSPQL